MIPKILHIAWKFDEDSTSLSEIDESKSDNYFFAFKNRNKLVKSKTLFKGFGYFFGVCFYLLNKIKCKIRLGNTDQLTSLLNRNIVNEFAIRFLIWKYDFSEVRIHWVGYGFLPTASIVSLSRFSDVTVFHHDWYHFTGGVHVPVISRNMFSVLECSFGLLSGLKNKAITHVFVSNFQEKLLRNLHLSNFTIQENQLRPAFSSARLEEPSRVFFDNRLKKGDDIFIMFIGVTSGNCDNKGVSTVSSILNCLDNERVFSIGVGCDNSINFDLSIPRADPKFIFKLLSLIDLCVITSRLETFSMVALESQFCGTPVVYRRSLAPSSFKNRNFLYPAIDDSDRSLCFEVKKRLYTKRESLND